MRIHQILFLGFVVVALVIAAIKSPRKIVGGLIGAVFSFLVPFVWAQIYVWRGGDPTAAGALSFLGLFTIPLGIFIGVTIAKQQPKPVAPTREAVKCLGCGRQIGPKEERCPSCGWTWK